MIVVPANPNSIHVGMIRTGCLKTEFSSTYPTRLHGIISQNEFRESIGNINSKISSSKPQIVCVVIFILCLIIGIALLIASTVAPKKFVASQSTILIAVGCAMIFFASIVLSLGCCLVRTRRTTKMRQAIAEESKKYSSRSSTRCSWRLNVTRIWNGGYGRSNRTVFFYHIIIDIHRTIAPSESARLHANPTVSRPPSTVRSQDVIPPPPYPGPPVAFCSQCGVPRLDLSAKFCSSCGHPYNNL